MAKKKKTTDQKIDDLARAVKDGFDAIEERMATKDDVKRLEDRLDRLELVQKP
ncbi:MAG: hypothetical protein Q8P52_03580 [bacterium]|nr:hypothetical protein [bacterium]